MCLSEKKTVVAAPFDLQLFAEDAGGGAESVSSSAPATEGSTSSIIPGDDYASGGPEVPERVTSERIEFDKNDLNIEDADREETSEVPEAVKREQSQEANAAFAEMRRKVEDYERRMATAQQQRDQYYAERFGATHGIQNEAQYIAALEQTRKNEESARQQALQNRPRQIAQQTYQQLLKDGYEEVLAREMANAKGQAEAAILQNQAMQERLSAVEHKERERQEQRNQQEFNERVARVEQSFLADLDQLRREFGDIVPKTVGDLDESTANKIRSGYTLYDAWFTTNRSKVLSQKERATYQRTLNNLDSKKHLRTEGDGAGDSSITSIPLPGDTLQMYKDSGMSEKQARAFHKKLYG